MKKIVIIGNGGTGKSTLGSELSKALKIKVYHLDKMTYKPGWIRIDETDFKKDLDKIISSEEWIIEGWSYHSTLNQRLEAADTIIYLRFPVYVCYWYAFLRHVKYFYRQNEFDPDNSPILFKTRKMIKAMWLVYKKYEPELIEMLNIISNKRIIEFRKRKDVNTFLQKICQNNIT